jgi:hypothetical protein
LSAGDWFVPEVPALRIAFGPAVDPFIFALGGDLRVVVGDVALVLAVAFREGERPLPVPSLPRFIMLAGVTGASEGVVVAELSPDCDVGDVAVAVAPAPCSVCWPCDSDPVLGGAGGGIDKSTGEGVSPTASPIVNTLLGGTDAGVLALGSAGIAGVDVNDATPRLCAPARFATAPPAPVLRIGRTTGECCFLRTWLCDVVSSPLLVEAPRFFFASVEDPCT